MFDADGKLQEFELPQLKVGGELLTGRPLSIVDAPRLIRQFEALKPKLEAGAGDELAIMEEVIAFVRELCTAMDFPPDKVLSLPPELVVEAVADFFASQGRRRARAAPVAEPAPPLETPTLLSS